MNDVRTFQPWEGYEDEDEDALIRRLDLKVDESRDRYDRAYAQAVCAAVASYEQLNHERGDERYRERVHARAADLLDEVGGWQRS